MTKKVFLILITACFSISISFSQDKLLLLNGKERRIKKTYIVKEDEIIYSLLKNDSVCIAKKMKAFSKKISKDSTLNEEGKRSSILKYQDNLSSESKNGSIDKFDVFSIKKSDGTEEIIYSPDTASGDPSSDWVRAYIKGQQYGRLHRKERWCSKDGKWHRKFNFTEAGGLVVGGAASILSFYAIPVPAVYALINGRINSRLPAATDIEESMRGNDAFKAGFQKQRRNQRIKQGFVSGMIGLVAGFATFTIIENN